MGEGVGAGEVVTELPPQGTRSVHRPELFRQGAGPGNSVWGQGHQAAFSWDVEEGRRAAGMARTKQEKEEEETLR